VSAAAIVRRTYRDGVCRHDDDDPEGVALAVASCS